jgi:acetate kinase
MKILLLNAGSSSLKASLVESADRAVLGRSSIELADSGGYAEAVEHALGELHVTAASPPAAVGHRIVHGGEMSGPQRITPEVRARIAALSELAPLHNPPGLETLAAAEAVFPKTPHVAVFDTAFHTTMPAASYTYAVPHAWAEQWGVRRYGFHGLSHAYATGRAAEMLGRPASALRLVICHLGHGCSATAVLEGRSIDTTMGFTPLDGLMMATRSGSLDPGILTHVQLRRGLSARELDEVLNHGSGLYGVSGVSADMREVIAARKTEPRARLAFDVFAHRVRQAIGALAVTLGGVDALVFTGGVGENSADLRAAACRGVECLGLELDAGANARLRPDADIARSGARARILVVAAREDLQMVSEVMKVVAPTRERST